MAQESGAPVVIDSETTETQLISANPDGTTTAELSATPVRVEHGDGWVPVDTSLVIEADGRIAPDAAALDVSFSGGGADALVVVREGGTSLTWRWPGDLPAPIVTGDTAVYPEVLPGVDLQLRAGVESFSEVLVVRDREAAGDPRLAQLTLQSEVEGGELSRRDGGLVVTDMAGEVVLNSNPALMWDASGAQDPGLHRLLEDSVAIGDAGFSADGPVEGDVVKALDVALVDGHLEIAVDQSMLSDPETTFPVVIDPELSAVRNSWAMVNKSFSTQEYYNWSDASEGVGYVTGASYGTHTKRLFWDFDTSPFRGKNILGATFSAKQTHAYDCTANAVQLWRTGTATAATNWSNPPTWIDLQSTHTVKLGRTGCSPAGGQLDFPATSAMQWAASNNQNHLSLGLRAASETSSSSWRRFESTVTLAVDFNTPPVALSAVDLGLSGTPKIPCVTGSGRPWVNSRSMTLQAIGRDADKPYGQTLQAHFEYWYEGGFRELESGRLRYYGNLTPAAKQGEMAGRRLVREWDPGTGATRTWHETLDRGSRELDTVTPRQHVVYWQDNATGEPTNRETTAAVPQAHRYGERSGKTTTAPPGG